MTVRDPYSVLGVARSASKDEIRNVYRKLAREHHPDVNPDDPHAEERFKDISAAYNVLSDEEKRTRYDEFGPAGLQDGFDPNRARQHHRGSQGFGNPFQHGDLDLDEMLRSAFGGGRQRARGPERGADARGEVHVDFLDAARGGEISVQFEGKGSLRIKIPAGADDGTRIRLAGQGQAGFANGPPGDLYLTLLVRPHRFFERNGSDLSVDVPVTLAELVLGAGIQVPTPDGSVTMTVPPGSSNGQKLRLRGRGAGRVGSSERGDLYVRLTLALPETDDPRLAELAKEMEPLYEGTNPREHLQ